MHWLKRHESERERAREGVQSQQELLERCYHPINLQSVWISNRGNCRPHTQTQKTHERIKVEKGFLPHEIHHAYATGSSLGLRQTYCGNSVESKGAGLMIRDETQSCSLNLQAANHRINNQRESEERGREESAALNANPCLIKISSI